MSKYSRDMIAKVLAVTDIVKLIGSFTDLAKAGENRYKAFFRIDGGNPLLINGTRQMCQCFEKGNLI